MNPYGGKYFLPTKNVLKKIDFPFILNIINKTFDIREIPFLLVVKYSGIAISRSISYPCLKSILIRGYLVPSRRFLVVPSM